MSLSLLGYGDRFEKLAESVIRIPREYLQAESDLLLTKWPDYAFTSPLDLTRQFGCAYQKAFKRACAQHRDYREADKVVGIDWHKMMSTPGEFTKLWIARQDADRCGLRYEDYLHFTFEFALDRKRRRFPRPNQLRANAKTSEAWLSKFKVFVDDGISARSKNIPQFRREHYQGLPAQDRFRELILELAKGAGRSWLHVMRERVVEKHQMPAIAFASVLAVDNLREHARKLKDEKDAGLLVKQPCEKIEPEELWQSCYGVPGAQEAGNLVCGGCPQAAGCRELADRVLAEVKQRTGFGDPVRAAALKKNRERVKKCREKKAAAAPSAGALSA
ncbi:hypothetical protein GOL49_14700 [Sinorhizobium medicae]|nr:hypothetical protein [Sinorhizobium meliloti]MDX1082250.1 hypothetical protein [Sinorhizobium medicae]